MARARDEDKLDRVFHALSDRTRRALLRALSEGDSSVTALAEPFAMSLQAVMKHLAVLEAAELISVEKTGRVKRCHFEPEALVPASAWVKHYEAFWRRQLEGLEAFLDSVEKPKT
jgi:DNA-binding transcriptional ArsR family regulator